MLPIRRPIGVQLGLGIEGPAVYSGTNEAGKWITGVNEKLSERSLHMKMISLGPLLDKRGNSPGIKDNGNNSHNDDEFVSDSDDSDSSRSGFEDEEEFEHWKSILVSKMNWDNLSPVIPENLQIFSKVDMDHNNFYDINESASLVHRDFIPGHVLETSGTQNGDLGSFLSRHRKKISTHTFDPTISGLLHVIKIQTVSDLRNGKDPHNFVVCVSGNSRSRLVLGVMDDDYVPLSEPDTAMETKARTWFIKTSKNIVNIPYQTQIKKIVFPKLSDMFDRTPDMFAVITDTFIQIIKITNINSTSGNITYSLSEKLKFNEFSDFPFSDMAFNPWDMNEIAVVDIMGNWSIGKIKKSLNNSWKISLVNDMSGSIFDEEELSNWKKISWSSSYTRLVIMSRSQMIELDFMQNWQITIVEAKSWSTLRDYKRVDDKMSVLLTSKEIIFLDTNSKNDQITRKLSWKHDISLDNTIKFSFHLIKGEEETEIIIFIYSKKHPLLYVHVFSINVEGLLQASKNSRVITLPGVSNGIGDVTFIDSPNLESDQIYSTDTENSSWNTSWINVYVKENKTSVVHRFILSRSRSHELNGNNNQSETTKILNDEIEGEINQHTIPVSVEVYLHKIFENLFDFDSKIDDSQNIYDLFQSFGYKISNELNGFIDKLDDRTDHRMVRKFLKEFGEFPNFRENIAEFESFIKQLMEHYEGEDIIFTDLKHMYKSLLHEDIDGLELLFNKLLQCWEMITDHSEVLTTKVIMSIIWTIISFCKRSHFTELDEELTNRLKEPYKEIIDTWDMDESELDEELEKADLVNNQFFSQPQFSLNTETQIPTIRSSQVSRNVNRGTSATTNRVSKISRSRIGTQNRLERPVSSFLSSQPSTLPDTMTPAFTLMQSNVPTLSQSQGTQLSQRSKKKKKRVGGFG
ncbi:hypothetical protein Kpol_1032p56 [Vanderwaltozyma polyspora DSM 70294]|uniref:RNA polymerase I-specific transcription initiation factor RRN6 n=1 Tax=Vanderwaltozyma polyspora (strain ATCC 22028 / DSM 70294 / BCRC 21397 / CBS 2163 / NBRC 10782 / NRRL Y-8283 / UCD 57-17) TaxID=436907 RepID=A7TH10_VANPO|nr:uncharacterized protein Kpol_1032p56 [Vanderwaltozyma polyspora DSM 70294]EDO18462.1 hypothetical protein Kpol_1032p56 [Vanderwaltozyma polyspora DSM 70294]